MFTEMTRKINFLTLSIRSPFIEATKTQVFREQDQIICVKLTTYEIFCRLPCSLIFFIPLPQPALKYPGVELTGNPIKIPCPWYV